MYWRGMPKSSFVSLYNTRTHLGTSMYHHHLYFPGHLTCRFTPGDLLFKSCWHASSLLSTGVTALHCYRAASLTSTARRFWQILANHNKLALLCLANRDEVFTIYFFIVWVRIPDNFSQEGRQTICRLFPPGTLGSTHFIYAWYVHGRIPMSQQCGNWRRVW